MTEDKRFNLAYEIGDWWAVTDGDITLWKEEVVSLLNDLNDEIEQLKSTNMEYEDALGRLEEDKQQKRFLKIHNDYYLQYGDDKELFDLHKPADIRSLCIILNREHGFSELQCEYNDKEYLE